jgi:hypothetical protein
VGIQKNYILLDSCFRRNDNNTIRHRASISHVSIVYYLMIFLCIKNQYNDVMSAVNLSLIPLPALNLLPIQKYVERNERYILDISRDCLFKYI